MNLIEPEPSDPAPFLGREDALSAASQGLNDVLLNREGAPRACFITGPTGVGKEHLLRELAQQALDAGCLVREVAPERRSLGGILPILRSAYDAICLEAPSRARRYQAVARFLKGGPGMAGAMPDAAEIADLLLASLHEPSVWIFPRAHQQDPMSADVLCELLRRLSVAVGLDGLDPHPCFIALSLDDDDSDVSIKLREAMTHAIPVPLSGLDLPHLAEFVTSILGNQPLSAGRLEELHTLTAGIPARVSEAIHTLQDAGELVEAEGAWGVRDKRAFVLPSSTNAVIAQRIASLGREELEILRVLAVEAGPFGMAYAMNVTGDDASSVRDWMERTILEQTWVETSLCLRFSVDGFREALLATLTPLERAAAHGRRAAWLEEHLAPEDAVELLAAHWTDAGESQRAMSFIVAAAKRSQSAGDLVSTIDWYRRALLHLSDSDMAPADALALEVETLFALGTAERSNAQTTKAKERFETLLRRTDEQGDPEAKGRALDILALIAIETGELETALSRAHERRDLAFGCNDVRGKALSLRLLGVIRREIDGPAAGIVELEEALSIAGDSVELTEVRARIAIALSYAHTESGDPEAGLSTAMWGLALSRDAQLQELEASFLINISMAHFVLGRPDLTLRWATEAMDVCEAKGLRRTMLLALGNAGDAMRALGKFSEAGQTLRSALKETYRVGGGDLLVARMLELAHLLMDQGEHSEAAAYLSEAWRLESKVKSDRHLYTLYTCELRFRLGPMSTGEPGPGTASTGDLIARAEAWASEGADAMRRLEWCVHHGTWLAGDRPRGGRKFCAQALELSESIPVNRLIGKPDLAAMLLALVRRSGSRRVHKQLAQRLAEAIDTRAASVDDRALREAYLSMPLVMLLREG